MLLKNKIRNEVEIPLYDHELKGIEKVAEDFAIEFAEWMFINYPNQYKLYQYKDEIGFYTTKELLEIYKKQKQF